MNKRKKHVMDKAHELFIENGFQHTSIQDILAASNISKGTFYNYFSSKNELLISIFKNIYTELEWQRKQLLIGQDKADSVLFIKQIEMLIKTNNQYKIISLFEEILFTNDEELKGYIKNRRVHELNWVYNRLMDVCGPTSRNYLVDCSILLMGMIHSTIYMHSLVYQENANIHQIVQYCVNRILEMVKQLSHSKDVLLKPETLYNLINVQSLKDHDSGKKEILCLLYKLKADLKRAEEFFQTQEKMDQLLEFIEEEIEMRYPRYFILESTLKSLSLEVKDTPFTETVVTLAARIEKVFSKQNR
ncbi:MULTISPECIES: TetR/AcrR family transcriptional regulator [Niallia]|uniref:Helix-turn-helix transcriptional regulator n=1 Tax=Niallia alba TaxID=2729105 RepID=A0A7Y0K7B7_9BACI|nr:MULTISPECIES: TetR/AcrR family transcriptional regulator [Niallia]MED3794067.1 TetR/AcrR family transcriptional regulator [Niallia alba]NMO77095.1 helix-turn-helix transcriptional regulator [Niallia alba]UTI40317.1 TetR/AcrR family transcriptional regulator [Niallia sp. RD1]